MNRALMSVAVLSLSTVASNSGADNFVTWTVRVGPQASPTALALPASLFKDHLLPTKGSRWRCVADRILRQDDRGNTYSEMSVRCTDGETTVSSSASCQIGAHGTDRFSMDFVEKTTAATNTISAQCDG